MLFRSKLTIAIVAAIAVFATGCFDDEPETIEEPIQPEMIDEPLAPIDDPVDDQQISDFIPETTYFGFDDYTLNLDAQQRLSDLAENLKSNPSAVVQIEGHCDERGSIEYNLALGERRAQSVKNYLVNLGVDPARLSTISYGEEKPAMEGHDEGAWSRNRRAEFIITNN